MNKKMQIELSVKEKKLMVILLALLFLFFAYQFGYLEFMERAEKNNKESNRLEEEVEALELMNINKKVYTDGITECEESMKKIRGMFLNQETPEDIIMFLRGMEEKTNIQINEITLYEKTMITNLSVQTSGTQTVNQEEENEFDEIQKENTVQSISTDGNAFIESGYEYVVDIKIKCKYEELKAMIAYINKYPSMRTIDCLSVVFDAGTGKLMGELSIKIYTLLDGTYEYVEPITGVVAEETDNIFDTIQ
ncbi:hypothetical protein [Anaerosporobacter faecicola]|uniref:hypothetical protein n=1 Tax=Anaerosporobacter faecicola TaxID=2718714 RepID=UPI00143891EC|nr:hypothetical protein [Anaerosporobacter faecicola]